MTEEDEPNDHDADIVGLAVEIVAAYISNNAINPTDLPRLIADVHGTVSALGSSAINEQVPIEKAKPAVPIRKSVTPDYITCLEDGLKFKSIKRHLSTHHNMTPDEYRTKWALPSDYPMVAPSYSKRRSEMAKKVGLGNKRG